MSRIEVLKRIALPRTAAFLFGLLTLVLLLSEPAVAGLVAHYTFDGDASDSSGSGLHGTVNGATLAPDRFGNANSAYSFSGTNQNIEVADDPIFEFGLDPYSISFWFNLADVTTYQPFLGQWGNRSPSALAATLITYNISNSGVLRVHEENGPPNSTDLPVAIATDQWHLLTLVRETTGPSKVYLDASFLGSMSNRESIHDANTPFLIGQDPNTSESFSGLMDDVRIYDMALSHAQIQNMFAPVPEPSTLTLAALGLVALMRWRRRK